MSNKYRINSLKIKSIGKFWVLSVISFTILFAFQKGLTKAYEEVSQNLHWEFFTPFLILLLSMGILIVKTLQLKCEKVIWKPYDAILTASLLYIIRIFVLDFTAVEISFVDFIRNGNNALLFLFIVLTCLYVCIKFILWPKNFILKTKTGDESNEDQYDQDLSLELTKDFEDIADINKLKDLDKLGRFDHAQQISEVINNVKPKKSFAIGINGDWGSGKTSFIHLVKRINKIEHPNACKFITFNPWYFTGTEKVLLKFHETLLANTGSFSLSFRNELHRYFQLICATETRIWKSNFLQYFQKHEDFQSQHEKLKDYFEQLPQKIVIIIDDLDRLQKDEILVLFRTIRLIADFPNVVYIVGYSPEYIKNILDDTGVDDQPGFMEKIFQLEFDLPEPMPSDLRTFWKCVIEKHIPDDGSDLQMGIIDNIVTNSILPNLRDIKRFLNQLTINSSLPEIKNNTYFPQFFLLELIYYYDTEAYEDIRKSKSFDNDKYLFSGEELDKGTKKLIEQIKKLDKNTKHSVLNLKHFNKYFFKRLNREKDIDIKEVLGLFISPEYEKRLRQLYFINESQIIDHVLEIIDNLDRNKNKLDQNSWTQYFDRLFFLFEFIFTSEEFDKNYFNNGAASKGRRLIKGISTICKLISNENPPFTKEVEYFKTKLHYKSFSEFILIFESENKEMNVIFYKLNEVFRDKIRYEIKCCLIDTTPLLIALYNCTKFIKSVNGLVSDCVFNDEYILKGLREKSEILYSDIKKLNEKNKELSILNFFGSKDALLKLNDYNNDSVFRMLDSLKEYYPM
ncbi:MAG: hypothetical protein JXR82_03310 [Marinifilaceae bacterium]|nr:hypothetical protein [Marinifilaceae bacterium]